MKPKLTYIISSVLFFSSLCVAQIFKEQDIGDLRITIYEENPLFLLKGINKLTGYFYGPAEVYHGLDGEEFKGSMIQDIILDSMDVSYLNIIPPLYKIAVNLPIREETDLERQITVMRIQIGDLTKGLTQEKNKQYYGKTVPEQWQKHRDANGIYADIDFSPLGLTNVPLIQTTLVGAGDAWATTGGSTVYDLTNQACRVYVRYEDARNKNLNATEALEGGWYLLYTITSQD